LPYHACQEVKHSALLEKFGRRVNIEKKTVIEVIDFTGIPWPDLESKFMQIFLMIGVEKPG
jgi:hypothetical protein